MDWFITVTDAPAQIVEASSRGDYSGDGSVDAADYVVWAKNARTQAEYDTWRGNFGVVIGNGANASVNAAVPEPTSFIVALAGALGVFYRWRAIMLYPNRRLGQFTEFRS
jgi:hypothetical protein